MMLGRREFLAGGSAALTIGALGKPIRSALGGRREDESIPSGPYDAQVEYLESAGDSAELGPYILSQYNIVAGNIFEVLVEYPYGLSGGTRVLGRNAGNYECFINFGGTGYFGGGSFNIGAYLQTNTLYEFVFNLTPQAMALTINGTTIKTSTSTQPNRYNFPLFIVASNAQNILNKNVPMRIYRFRAWSGGSLVEDFIPVRKDGIGYMYDLVSEQCIGNQGADSFIIGPDKR